MPRGDGTGPMGLGPMTGRGAGFCAGFGVPGFMNPFGYRMGWGRGVWGGWGGRGWRNMYYATGLPGWARAGYAPAWGVPPAYGMAPGAPAPEQEVEFLRAQAEQLKAQLDAIAQRIEELETSSE
ncbi:MAG TPA: DUF5320 domain-containing protein [Caldilineae bacterium]|nr:DUF5320 domain-containing protein [Caldilineae bacterium]